MGPDNGMTPERWQRIKELFDQALPLSPPDRLALLESSVDEDPSTIEEVLRLLARSDSDSVGSFLERPVGDARKILDDAAADRLPSLEIGQRLDRRFVIESFIAHGGMGEVYRAFDTELRIPVATKTLRREYARDSEFVERFRREVQLARDARGDHLCKIFDIGRDGDGDDAIVYLSMEFLDGPTLRDVIKQEGPLALDVSLEILAQIADGLESLSRSRMVHRDLKPGNIVIEGWKTPEQRAVITDFGLARASVRSRRTSSSAQLTETSQRGKSQSGRIAGTPDYMAPEQLNGKPVSAATDLFAFGLIAYEMISGQRPFDGDGWESAYLRLTEEPEPLKTHLPNLPTVWDSAILRCLEREPELRPPSAMTVIRVIRGEQPVSALNRSEPKIPGPATWLLKPALAVAILLVVAMLGWFAASQGWFGKPNSGAEPVVGKQVAVLPFSYSEEDPMLRPYADGLMDTITRRLSQFEQSNEQLLVVPVSEVQKQNVKSASDALRRFRVDYAIEGRVDSQEDRVRLTLTVVDTATMRQKTTAVIEEPRSRLLNLQDGAIARLSNALNLRIALGGNPDIGSALRISPAAYDFYLQGRGYLQRNDRIEDVRSAVQLFERALSIDPKYAPAMSGLADAQWYLFERSRDRQWVEQARKSAAAALVLNSQLPDVHITLGRIQNGTGEYEEAVKSYQEALKIDSRNPDALYGLGAAYAKLNQKGLAESTYLRAVSYRPSDWRAHKQLGLYYYESGDYQKALEPLRYVVELTPDNAQGYNNLGVVQWRLGDVSATRASFERSIELDPRVSAITNLSSLEFQAGNYEKSIEWNQRALKLNKTTYRAWGNIGSAYLKLGNKASATNAYQEAIGIVRNELKVNPRSGSLYSYLAHYQASISNPGLKSEVLANLRKAEELEPYDPEVWYRNAETYIGLGDDETALRALRQALDDGYPRHAIPPNSPLNRLLEQLPASQTGSAR